MQINLNQDEITAAVEDYVRSQIAIKDNQTITIDFTAGRGANGLTAALDISAGRNTLSPVPRSVPRAVETLSEPELPTEDPEPVLTDEKAPEEPAAKTPGPKDIFGKKSDSDEAPEPTDEATPSDETSMTDEEEAAARKSIFSKKKAS